jgi:hypothetical protein
MAVASEAEIGALLHNGQVGAHLRQVLKELGHAQSQPTRIATDNSTADGFADSRTKIIRSKAMDMRFYWIQDRVMNGELVVHANRRAQPSRLLHQAPPPVPLRQDETYLFTHWQPSIGPLT